MRAWVKTAKLIQHVKLVHIFNVLFCRGGEQLKLFVSALSFSFQRIDLSFSLSLSPSAYSSEPCPFHVSDFLYMSALLVIASTLFFLLQSCPFISTLSFRFNPVFVSSNLSFFVSTLSFRFNPFLFVSTFASISLVSWKGQSVEA